MNYSDEELQRRIEGGQAVDDTFDARAYQKVFEALNKVPYTLPGSFADTVINKLEIEKTSLSKDYFWFGLGLLSFLVATAITIMVTRFSVNFGVFRFLSGYYGIIMFGAGFILFLQWLDKKVIQRKLQI